MKIYVAELLGAFLLVLIGTACIAMGGFDATTEVGRLAIGFSFGFALIAAIYSFGSISGAHLNPAVSFAFYCAGKMPFSRMILYCVCQCIGALLATSCLFLFLQTNPLDVDQLSNFGANGWDSFTYQTWKIFLIEVLATFLFVLVIFQTHKKDIGGLAIGFMLVALHFAFIPISGSSLNPARSLAPALFSGREAMAQLWLYLTAPMVGGGLVGLMCLLSCMQKQEES